MFSLFCSPNSKMDKVKHNRLESHSVFKVLFFFVCSFLAAKFERTGS